LTEKHTDASKICYTNTGIFELEVSNCSYNRSLHYEVRDAYTDCRLAGGIVKPSKTKSYRMDITEEIHLVPAAYVIISSLDSECNGFAVLRGFINYSITQSFTKTFAV
jgi:hypothetical protein